jgi:tetrahydromethanopterin S-methyltransferase subunit E
MMSSTFPYSPTLFFAVIVVLLYYFLIGGLAGFLLTLTIISINYKQTKYYKNRFILSFLVAVIFGIIGVLASSNLR